MLFVYGIHRLVVSIISSGKQKITGLWIPRSWGVLNIVGVVTEYTITFHYCLPQDN
jgi:hypothetical protein